MTSVEQLMRLANDSSLKSADWDSYGAAALDARAIQACLKFLGYQWAVVPTPSGGIQLEMHHSGCDIEVEFNPDGSLADVYSAISGG